MTVQDLKPGQILIFTPTGKELTIGKVTETRVSWYFGFVTKSSWGRNNMKMAWASVKQFQAGIDKGSYVNKG